MTLSDGQNMVRTWSEHYTGYRNNTATNAFWMYMYIYIYIFVYKYTCLYIIAGIIYIII